MKIDKRIKKYSWELAKKIKGKSNLTVARITTRCNLRCPYCSARTICKIPLDLKERTPEYWIKELDKFSIIVITGGDPSQYEGVHKIVNALIKRKKLVKLLTNLVDIEEFRKIKPSWRLFFFATFHSTVLTPGQTEKFKDNYKELSRKHPVLLKELRKKGDNTPSILPQSKIYQLIESEKVLSLSGYFPDGSFREGEVC